MNGTELSRARKQLDVPAGELASELGVPLARLQEWERGTRAIPHSVAQQVLFRVALLEHDHALEAAGLPPCEWVVAWEQEPYPVDLDAERTHIERLNQHAEACPDCQARVRYAEEHLPPLPALGVRGFWGRGAQLLERVPSWARPAVILLAGMVGMRIVFDLPRIVARPALLGEGAVAMLAAGAAGAAGGLVYSAVGPPLCALGRTGDYVRGVVCVLAYTGSLALAAPYAFGERLVDGSNWLLFVGVSVIFGLFIGHSWFGQIRAAEQKR